MSFNPLGAFAVKAPLLPAALAAAKAIRRTFPQIPAGMVERIYLHWAVEKFGCLDGAYNGEVDFENGAWVMKITHEFRDNMAGLDSNASASHTWERNTNAIGIAITGMDGASEANFGADGVQLHELEFLCAFAAAVCTSYNVDSLGKVAAPGRTHPSSNDSGNHPGMVNTTGEWLIETHATCAMYDDYEPERWDLAILHADPNNDPIPDGWRRASAAALRGRIHEYAEALRA